VVSYKLLFAKQSQKDAVKIKNAGLKEKTLELLEILQNNPYQNPPPDEKLTGDLTGAYSRRINVQHRLVYQILEEPKIVKVLRMWAHYE
jgi:toxin YoeB